MHRRTVAPEFFQLSLRPVVHHCPPAAIVANNLTITFILSLCRLPRAVVPKPDLDRVGCRVLRPAKSEDLGFPVLKLTDIRQVNTIRQGCIHVGEGILDEAAQTLAAKIPVKKIPPTRLLGNHTIPLFRGLVVQVNAPHIPPEDKQERTEQIFRRILGRAGRWRNQHQVPCGAVKHGLRRDAWAAGAWETRAEEVAVQLGRQVVGAYRKLEDFVTYRLGAGFAATAQQRLECVVLAACAVDGECRLGGCVVSCGVSDNVLISEEGEIPPCYGHGDHGVLCS
jgi:hypothetical protein